MERWRQGQPVGSIHGRCRVHRAEILRLRGSCVEAEKEALLACEELRPYLRREFGWPLTELGRIRLRRGDVPGAEAAFLAAHEAGWDPQPGLALVHLAQGDVALAAASIRDALAHPGNVPSKEVPPNTELRRAPLLEAQVEIEVAAGNLDAGASGGRASSRASRRCSRARRSRPARPSPAEECGWPQATRPAPASEFAAAAHLWNEVGAPYETALARMGLGDAYRAEGREAPALLEFRAARSAFEQIGARLEAARAAQACGDGARPAAGDARAGPSERLPPRGRLLVRRVRGAHRAPAGPEGHASRPSIRLPSATTIRPYSGGAHEPRACPLRRRRRPRGRRSRPLPDGPGEGDGRAPRRPAGPGREQEHLRPLRRAPRPLHLRRHLGRRGLADPEHARHPQRRRRRAEEAEHPRAALAGRLLRRRVPLAGRHRPAREAARR